MAVVWMTADGGQTWQRIASPPVAPVRHILFITQQDGWLYGPGLLSTHDGGHIWANDHPQQDVLQIANSGRSTWALESTCLTDQSCLPSLMRSRDMGRTWQLLPNQPPAHPTPAPRWHTTLLAEAPDEVWLFSPGSLSYTRDSGQHWSELGPPPCGGLGLATLVSGRIWLVCPGGAASGLELREIHTSDDRGASWRIALTAAHMSLGYARSLAAVSCERVFLGASRAGLLQSDDGGVNWRKILPEGDYGAGIPVVVFVDAAHGWVAQPGAHVAGGNVVLRTFDSGESWNAVALP